MLSARRNVWRASRRRPFELLINAASRERGRRNPSMKPLHTLVALVLASVLARAQEPFRDLALDEALGLAKNKNKLVLLDFTNAADATCKKFEATLKDSKVRAWIADKTIALKVDAQKEADLFTRFRVDPTNVPTIVLASADGIEIDRLVGMLDPAKFLAQVNAATSGKDSATRAKDKLAGHENDPAARMKYGDALLDQGQHKEALEQYLWCFDHGLETPAFAAERSSSGLDAIVRLGRLYPAAIDALMQRSQDAGVKLASGNGSDQDLSDFALINRRLARSDRMLELYDEVKAKGDALAPLRKRLAPFVTEALIEAQRYEDYLDGADDVAREIDAEIARGVSLQSKPKKKGAAAGDPSAVGEHEQRLASLFGDDYEALLGAGRADQANKLADRWIGLDASYATYEALLRHARRSNAVAAAQAITRRGLASQLSESDKVRLCNVNSPFPRLK